MFNTKKFETYKFKLKPTEIQRKLFWLECTVCLLYVWFMIHFVSEGHYT